MGVLSFLKVRRAGAAAPAAKSKPTSASGASSRPHYGPAKQSPDAALERLVQQFGADIAPAAAAIRDASQRHRTGQKAQAWATFDALLADPGFSGSPPLRSALESEIYSRMRICLEREGCFNPALTPAVLSYATRAKSYSMQGRDAEFAALRSPDFFERYFLPLLQRARLDDAQVKFRVVVEEHLKVLPMLDLPALSAAVEEFRLQPPRAMPPTGNRKAG